MSADVLIEKDGGWFDPRDYTTVPNRIVRDSSLSFEARGLLVYIASHVARWQVRMTDLQREGGCGRDRIRRIVAELEQAGYLVREQQVDDGGRYGVTRYSLRSRRSAPVTENPSPDNPTPENTTPYKKPIPREDQEREVKNSSAPLRDAGVSAEALFEVEQPEPAPSEPVDEYAAEPGFGEFWTAYPSSKGKRAALMAYRRARRRGASPAQILAGAQRYAAERSGADPAYTAHGATWLNGARYDDVPDDRPQQRRGGTLGPADPAPASAFAPVSPADDPENAPFDPNDMPEHIASRMRRGADLTGWTLNRYVRSELDMRAALRAEDDETFDRIMRARADAREAAGTTTRGFVRR